MNLLITCGGRRNELISYFKDLEGIDKVHVCDMDNFAPAFIEADKIHIVPSVFDENYIEELLNICKEEKINLIFSINDFELLRLAENRKKFKAIGVLPLISSSRVIQICLDKIKTQNFLLENGFMAPKLYQFDEINKKTQYPIIVKPRFGTASIGVACSENFEEFKTNYAYSSLMVTKTLMTKFEGGSEILIQEKIKGTEFVVDIFNDLKGKYLGCIIKRRIAEKNGDASVTITQKNAHIESLCMQLAKKLKHVGNLDVDLILDDNNNVYFIDLNPRFGGGYPFSHLAGVNIPKIISDWQTNKFDPKDLDYQEGIVSCRTDKYFIMDFLNKKV